MRIQFKNRLKIAGHALRKHKGQIAYYGALALALSVLAWAAQGERTEQAAPQPDAIAVSMEEAQPEREAEQAPWIALAEMQILQPYSDSPRWDAYMKCWQTHAAVDYQCADGCVQSLTDGIVRAVGESAGEGGFAEIQAGEYLLRYGSIEAEASLAIGDAIESGACIGKADLSRISEAHLGAHVHLEVESMGKTLDYTALQAKSTHEND